MRITHVGIITLLCVGFLGFAGTAQASIEAFTNLLTENARVYNYDPVSGAIGSVLTDTSEVTIVSAGHSSTATANIASIPGFSSTTIGPVQDSTGFNTLQAGQGVALPGENFFNNFGGVDPPGIDPHAYADTNGTGALVLPGGGVIPPADSVAAQVSSVANVNLSDNLFSVDSGNATANTGVTAAFLVNNISGGTLDILVQFDAYVQQLIDLNPVPPGISASVDNSWSMRITDPQTGALVGSWAPNGIISAEVGFTELSDPFDLNSGPSGFPGFQTGPTTNATSGFTGIDGGIAGPQGLGGTNFAAWITLPEGPHSLVITHESSARATTFGIPEPSACIAWALLSLCAGVGVYVRRRRS